MRHDLFIIWGNGMPYVTGIMKMLRYAFEIVMIYKHQIKDLPKFVDDIYSCDSYPLSHLREKTRYLLRTDPECLVVLVENHQVDEHLVGVGPYRKPQCQYLVEVKSQIRGEFNQVVGEHVIHGTDYESQVHHILRVLGIGPLEKYTRQPHPDIPYPWHIPPVKTYQYMEQDLSQLWALILGSGLSPIEYTPHYQFIAGDRKPYEEYFYLYMGEYLREDHFPEAFDEQIRKWTGEYDPILVNKQGHILDGVHRAAIIAYLARDGYLLGAETLIKTYIL